MEQPQQQEEEPLTRKCFVCNSIFNVDATKTIPRIEEINSWRILCKYVNVPEEEVEHLVEYDNYYARYLTFCPEKCHQIVEKIIGLHSELEKLSALVSSTIVHHFLSGQKNNNEEQEKGIKRLKGIIVKGYKPKKVKKPKNTNSDFASDLQVLNSFLNTQPEEESEEDEEEEVEQRQEVFPIPDVKLESQSSGNPYRTNNNNEVQQTYTPNNYNCHYNNQPYQPPSSSSSMTPFPSSRFTTQIPNVAPSNNNANNATNNNNSSGGNSQNADEPPPRRSRKRPCNPEEWGTNKKKAQRMSGEEYTVRRTIRTEDGKKEIVEIKKSGRRIGPRCESQSCRKSKVVKCGEFKESERQRLFYTLWKTMNWTEKREWVLALIDTKPIKQRRKDTLSSQRTHTYVYHLPYRQFERKVVCRQMFLSTLGIKHCQIANWLKWREKGQNNDDEDDEDDNNN